MGFGGGGDSQRSLHRRAGNDVSQGIKARDAKTMKHALAGAVEGGGGINGLFE